MTALNKAAKGVTKNTAYGTVTELPRSDESRTIVATYDKGTEGEGCLISVVVPNKATLKELPNIGAIDFTRVRGLLLVCNGFMVSFQGVASGHPNMLRNYMHGMTIEDLADAIAGELLKYGESCEDEEGEGVLVRVRFDLVCKI